MTTKRANKLIEEIAKEKPNWSNKEVTIQAIGEIIEKNDSFVESFLLTESFSGKPKGVLWISEDIDYIPPNTLKILGKNGMSIKKKNYNRTNQIEFF